MATQRRWATVILGSLAIYTAIAVLGSLSAWAYFGAEGTTIDWTSFIANRFLEQWTCAIFVAPLFWLVDRYPAVGPEWSRNACLLFSAVLVFIAVKYAVMLPLYHLWAGRPAEPYYLALIDNAVPVMFDFTAIIGVAHALRYYREVQERERAAAELKTQLVQARLDTLRGQLQPHFLFNTLNAAATLMHENAAAADRMLTELGDLLRMSLDRTQQEITLAEEMELVTRYLDLMRYRFSDRLTVSIAVNQDARDALVPPFIAQPLVENALEHGIAARRGPGRLAIEAHRVHGTLELTVSDDGPGIPSHAQPGIGLTNVRARLRQLYGSHASLALQPVSGGRGVRAVVHIPYRERAAEAPECAVS